MLNKFNIVFLLLLVTLMSQSAAFAQKGQLEVIFTAVDSTSWLQLDSIKVMNRCQGCDTVLYWPDASPVEA